MGLSRTDSRGQPLAYQARLDREARHLHGAETVGDALQDDDEIVLHPSIEAGGGASACGERRSIATPSTSSTRRVALLARVAIEPDWQPAFDWTSLRRSPRRRSARRHARRRRHRRAALGRSAPARRTWPGSASASAPATGPSSAPSRRAIWSASSHEASSAVVARHGLPPGTVVRWIARAEPSVAGSARRRSTTSTSSRSGQPPAIDEAPLAAFLAGAAVRDGAPSAGASPRSSFGGRARGGHRLGARGG